MTRHQCRMLVVQSLFAWSFSPDSLDEILKLEWADSPYAKNMTDSETFFIQTYVRGVAENLDEIDEHIKENLDGWNFERISKVDMAILRQAIFALLFQKDCDAPIVFDEAITLAKEFSSPDSYKFVNAVLEKVNSAGKPKKVVVKKRRA